MASASSCSCSRPEIFQSKSMRDAWITSTYVLSELSEIQRPASFTCVKLQPSLMRSVANPALAECGANLALMCRRSSSSLSQRATNGRV